jgi:hypothetical protein
MISEPVTLQASSSLRLVKGLLALCSLLLATELSPNLGDGRGQAAAA